MPAYQNVAAGYAANVTLTTTTETQVIDSGRVAVSMATMRAIVTLVANVSLGTGVTSLTARIYRGSGLSGATVQQSINNTTASTTVDINVAFSEQVRNADFVEYTCSIQQNAATGSGSVVWALLRVDLING